MITTNTKWKDGGRVFVYVKNVIAPVVAAGREPPAQRVRLGQVEDGRRDERR